MFHRPFGQDFRASGEAFDGSYQMIQDPPQAYAYPAVRHCQYLHGDANHTYMVGQASISSSSPESLTFSSDGVSQGNQSSYLNTPSIPDADIHRLGNVEFLGQAHFKKGGEIGSEDKAWIHFDATNPSGKKDKNWRKCYCCFIIKRECKDGAHPTRCDRCKNSQVYCMGPIRTPPLIEIDTLKDIAVMAFQWIKVTPDLPTSDIWPHVDDQMELQRVVKRSLPVQMPLVLTEFPYLTELPAVHEMLDILSTFGHTRPRPMKLDVFDLTQFENLCRRFCACLVLLRNLNTCRIDASNQNYPHIYRLALGFVMRLSLLANDLLQGIFEEVRACCRASRNRSQFPKLMGNLALFLGQILAEIRHLHKYTQSFQKLPLLRIFEPISATESEITFYGKSFGDKEFIRGSRADPRSLPGIHLRISGSFFPDQKFVEGGPPTSWPSIFGVLSLDLTSTVPRNNLDNASKIKTAASRVRNINATSLPNVVDMHTRNLPASRHGLMLPQGSISHQVGSDTIENRIAQLQSKKAEIQSEIERLQMLTLNEVKDIKALEGPPIPSDSLIDEFSSKQSSPYKSLELGINKTDTLVQAEPSLQATADVFNEINFDEAWAMLQEQMSPSRLVKTDLDIDMQDATDIDEGDQRRKRKRFSPSASSKKQANGTQLKDETALHAISDKASQTTTGDVYVSGASPQKISSTAIPLKKRGFKTHDDQVQSQINRKVAIVETSDFNDFDDANLQDCLVYGRRPKTWPLRQAFRQSLDISVKTIVRGFEKLRA